MSWRDDALAKGIDQNNLSELKAAGITPTDGQFAGSGGSSSGGLDWGNVLNNFQTKIDSMNAANKAANDTRFAQNRTDLTGAIGSYGTAAKGANDYVSDKYNLPGLVSNLNNLRTGAGQLQFNTEGTGAGGYASQNQVNNALTNVINPKMSLAASALGTASTAAQGEYANIIDPEKMKVSTLSDQIARESTGYSLEQKNELDSLLGQLSSIGTLGAAEMNRLTQLAQQENAYQIAKEANATSIQNMLQQTKYLNVAPGSSVVSTAAGSPVYSPGGISPVGSGTAYTTTGAVRPSLSSILGGAR